MRASLFTLMLLAACSALSGREQATAREFEIVVYGGTAGGISAAVQAARMGRTVVLLEPGKHLGGLTSGGLGATDIGNKKAIGGIAREFYQRIKKHYAEEASWKYEKRADFQGGGHDPRDDAAWTFEPHVAEKVFNDLLRQHKVTVVFGQRLDLTKGVHKEGARIVAIAMESGETYRSKMFIDATYEGDLMARAGVSYHVGRESNKTYGETLNGVQVKNAVHHQFVQKVDPFLKPGDPSSGLLPRVHAGPPGNDGEGDHCIQAYNFRLCATDRPENRRAWPRPANYDEKQYELLLRNFEAGDRRLPWNPILLPNRKTDSNNNYAFSTDDVGMNYAYPEGDYATRARIWQEHVTYQKGLLWTLANHPRVPEQVRKHFQTWGLARDEFVDNDNWPHQLYVREARRLVGAYVMVEQNCRGLHVAADSVGLAAYTMDSHNTQRYATREGYVRNEGDVQVGGFPPYPISYRSLVPKAGECTNLLVPVCLSASHISYGSIRMEPVFMVLGQSAATAAVLALDGKTDVQKVDYPKLRERLLQDKQVLDWTKPRRESAETSTGSEASSPDWQALLQKPHARLAIADLGLRPLLQTEAGRPITRKEDWPQRRQELERAWRARLGQPPQKPKGLDLRIESTERLDGYTRQLVSFQGADGDRILAYLLVPAGLREGEKRPAIVVFHQTTQDTLREPVGLGKKPQLALGLHLVQRGYVVLCPQCYIMKDGGPRAQAAVLAQHWPGWTGLGKMIFDASRCLDFLETLPYVDSSRLGCIGHSLGAKEVLFAMAFEPRYRVGVFSEGGIGLRMSNWTDPWYLTERMKGHIPALENHQVLALVAPRPLLLLAGDSADGDTSWTFVHAALPVYRLLGAEEQLGMFNHHAGHTLPQGARQLAYRWLDHWLRFTPVREEVGPK